jgi:hypothetical protein
VEKITFAVVRQAHNLDQSLLCTRSQPGPVA